MPSDVIDYKSIGIAASFGSGTFTSGGAFSEALGFEGKEAWQAEALFAFNKGTKHSVWGLFLGAANYVDPWSYEEKPDKTTDLSLGFLGKFYTAPTKGYYLTGFNFFFQPSLRYSISSSMIDYESELGYYDEESGEYVYSGENSERVKPFDVGIKTGVGFTFPLSPDKMNRLSISLYGDAGLLQRHSYGNQTAFFGLQLGFDFGL